MTQILIRNFKQAGDTAPRQVLIVDGIIREIATSIDAPEAKVVDAEGLSAAPSWTDLRCQLPEPGHEYRENFQSLARAAAFSGFSDVALLPDTDPVRDNKAGIELVNRHARQNALTFHPLGTITRLAEGKELAEMYDMKQAGARAFSDGNHTLKDAGMLQRALLYTRDFNTPLMVHALDNGLSNKGMVHEGVATTHLGLKGIPSLAEELVVQRDLAVLREYGGRLHFSHISTARSVEMIAAAKAEGLNISCDVALMSLIFEDEDLAGFDTNLKVLPPIRGASDRAALLKGLKDGTIDAIVSDHRPLDQESKLVEFDYAAYGASTIQAAFSKSLELLGWELMDKVWNQHPRRILGLEPNEIKVGSPAKISLFDTQGEWVLDNASNRSLSKNSPWWGETLKGYCKIQVQGQEIFETA